MNYQEFLETKHVAVTPVGFDVADANLNPMLVDWQKAVVKWAIKHGRAALFQDCGLGKTPQQLEWAKHVHAKTGKNVLILTPLAVAEQTIREAKKFGIQAHHARFASDVLKGINVTNYERLQHFDKLEWGGLVLDESSILKSFEGVTRKAIQEFAAAIPFRLACTATPAPNDLIELTNHAEFLDVMSGKEIIALFFKQDGNTTHAWRLKGHAKQAFWQWMAEWSVAIRKPSDLGYDDGRFKLPALHMHQHEVDEGKPMDGYLFALQAHTLLERRQARRDSLSGRVTKCAELVNASKETWLVWCDLNAESDALTKAIPGAVEVKGSDDADYKETMLNDFSTGKFRVLVSKPSIAGWGMNWQHCQNMAFVGLSDSYEQLYQAIRRCWRFGQTKPVHVHVITAQTEGAVVANIQRKEKQATDMFDNIVKHMDVHALNKQQERKVMDYKQDDARGDNWHMMLGDSCVRIKEIESDSVGLTVFSPPFPGMYAYTNSPRDIGNCKDIAELVKHFSFLYEDMLRITKPGRSCCIHLTQMPMFMGIDGNSGLRDFRGMVIESMSAAGWVYKSERTIDKDPQLKAARTKDHGLAMQTAAKDSSGLTGTMPDYLLQFGKPGDNIDPIRALIDHPTKASLRNTEGWITREEWIIWAAAIWYSERRIGKGGIRETDVLQARTAKESDDEKHLCPLQLGVIERCIKLWSNPGDVVFSPFAGIGSEGYQAVKFGRKFIGIELKESYWRVACENLAKAERDAKEEFLL